MHYAGTQRWRLGHLVAVVPVVSPGLSTCCPLRYSSYIIIKAARGARMPYACSFRCTPSVPRVAKGCT
jgi:hypothetical protein